MSRISALRHFLHMLVGMPAYEIYVRHMQERHPGRPVMTRKAFFRDRQQARYGGKGNIRCC